jgi:hypothetical protein
MADEETQEMGICEGKTVIKYWPEEVDRAPEGVQAMCSDRFDEMKWCGWKNQQARDPDVDPRWNVLDEDELYVHNGIMEEYHQAHTKQRSAAKFDRDL